MKESASSSFCFTFLKMVAWSWKVVVLCQPCDRSLLLGCHLFSLALLEGGVAGFCGDGSRSPGWKEVRGILSFLGNVDGYFGGWQGCCSLSLVVGMRPFLFFYYYYCFFGWAFIHFLKRHPLILLCKFTTSGDSQGHTQGLVSTFFSLFLGAAAPISKTTRRSLKIIWAISCLFSPSPCWCYFARKI